MDYLPAPPTLAELADITQGRLHAAARRRHSHTPSPRRDRYARHPSTLLALSARRAIVERAYSRTGSLEVVGSVLTGLARDVATRRRVDSPADAAHSREWTRVVVEADLETVREAVALGHLAHTPETPSAARVDVVQASDLEPLEPDDDALDDDEEALAALAALAA